MKKNQFIEKLLVQFLNDEIIPYFDPDADVLDDSLFELFNIHYREMFDKNLNETKDWDNFRIVEN